MSQSRDEVKLQVLICTMGAEGIRRVADAGHPRLDGVEYLVCWQLPDADYPVPAELMREDFTILKHASRGLSRNRNFALASASAPYCLIADDDVVYNPQQLPEIIAVFDRDPQLAVATFEYSGSDAKHYPDRRFDLRRAPKGYYVSSIEIAFRHKPIVDADIRFNENFGIGARFPSGEEDIWLHDALKNGLKGEFFPIVIANHNGISTGVRSEGSKQAIVTKGAVFRHTHRFSWPLRMLAHAWRNLLSDNSISTFPYLKLWLNGALARK